MLSPFSVVPFSIIAISLWGKALTLLYVMIGSLLGASIAFAIGAQAIHRLQFLAHSLTSCHGHAF